MISSLEFKEFLRWVVKVHSALLQQVAGVLKAKKQSQKVNSFTSTCSLMNALLLREARKKQVCKFLRESTAAQTSAAGYRRVSEWFLTFFGRKTVSPTFLNVGSILQSSLMRSEEAAQRILSQCVPRSTKALLHFHGIAYVNKCMQERHLDTELHCNTGTRTVVAV